MNRCQCEECREHDARPETSKDGNCPCCGYSMVGHAANPCFGNRNGEFHNKEEWDRHKARQYAFEHKYDRRGVVCGEHA